MEFREERDLSQYHINAYQPGTITVNGKHYNSGIIISTESFDQESFVDDISKISKQHIQLICNAKPEIILIGTGETQQFLHRDLLKTAAENNLSLDVMNSQAACRTFTVLATEGRRVLAAIIP